MRVISIFKVSYPFNISGFKRFMVDFSLQILYFMFLCVASINKGMYIIK